MAMDVLPGKVVGELGLLAPNQQRTQTLECIEDAEIMQISYDRIKALYFENPSFGIPLSTSHEWALVPEYCHA